MLDWLRKPYPYLEDLKLQIALSMLVGLICFLFLLVFRPFGLADVENVTFIFGLGAISTAVLGLHYFIFPRLWVTFFEAEKWNIGKQLFFFTSIILWIGCLLFVYNSSVGRDFSPQHSLPMFIGMAFSVGILPIIFMTYFIEKVADRRNVHAAQEIQFQRPDRGDGNIRVSIMSENQGEEDLVISQRDFLYAQAAGNYSEIHYWDSEVKSRLMRISLKDIHDQLDDPSQILRCHKSYLVNKGHLVEISGNARSLMLRLEGVNKSIPVSRSFPKSTLA